MSAATVTDRVRLQPGPHGQLRLAVPGLPRAPYATGQQAPCEPCAVAGVSRRGVSRDGVDSEPLCMSCWRGREQRRNRAAQAELERLAWDHAGDLATQETCAACGETEASSACWLCGYAWLQQMREQFDADQAAAAAEADLEHTRLNARTEAEARIADLTGWIERLRTIATAFADGGRRGRGVELLADALARLDAARTTARGRPPVTPYVAGVLAFDANWQSGRRALPGRERTAWLIGRSDRAVYDGCRRVVEIGWAVRVRRGGRNSLERRLETGRASDRGEFDLQPLHRSPVDVATRARFVPVALELLGELLQRALAVLAGEQDALDELRARMGTWTDWPELAHRARLRAAVARVQDTVTGPLTAALVTANICRTHMVSQGMSVYSCSYWGLPSSPQIMIHSAGCGLRPQSGRGEGGASRSSTEEAADLGRTSCRSPRLRHPRTAKGLSSRSRRRTPPAWAAWAPDLARNLVVLWPWLDSARRARVAATLGARLGPDWTAAAVVRWVARMRQRPVLDAPAAPLAYFRTLLDEALAGDVEPPHPARRHAEHRRQVAKAAGAEQTAESSRLRAELDARDAAAAASSGAGRAAMRAEMARLAARRRGIPAAAPVDVEWPKVAQPGSAGGCQTVPKSAEAPTVAQ